MHRGDVDAEYMYKLHRQAAHPKLSLVFTEGRQGTIFNGHQASAASLRHSDVGGIQQVLSINQHLLQQKDPRPPPAYGSMALSCIW